MTQSLRCQAGSSRPWAQSGVVVALTLTVVAGLMAQGMLTGTVRPLQVSIDKFTSGGRSNGNNMALGGASAISNWTNLTSGAQPPSGVGQAGTMVYDAGDDYLLYYDGGCQTPPKPFSCDLSETWIFTNGTWINITSTAGPAPSPRYDMAMAYDPVDGYVVAYGGVSSDTSAPVNSSTWIFRQGVWSILPCRGACPPLGFDANNLMTWDAADGYVLAQGNAPYSFLHGSWTSLAGNDSSFPEPDSVVSGSLAYSAAYGHPILFGGQSSYYRCSNTTWEWTGDLWVNITGASIYSPGDRCNAALAQTPDGELLLYGGQGSSPGYNVLNSTWLFSAGQWTNATGPLSPPALQGAQLALDSGLSIDVLEGGSPEGGYYLGLPVTWTWGPPPFANLTISSLPRSPDVGFPALFSASFIGGTRPLNYTWLFGDGNQSFSASPTQPFPRPGNYTVTLYLNDSFGHRIWAHLPVEVSSRPSIAVLAAPNPTEAGQPVRFSAVVHGGSGLFLYSWHFGDGNTSSFSAPTHPYLSTGNFTTTVWANDTGGGSIEGNITIEVVSRITVSSILASPSQIVLGSPINFTARTLGGVGPYVYSWSFGDGGTGGNLPNITHIFTTDGPFNVSVVATDHLGVPAYASIALNVTLSATIVSNASIGASPMTVAFGSEVSGGIQDYSYQWSFGDGSTSDAPDPVHVFTSAGTFDTTLEIRDSHDDYSRSTWRITTYNGGGPLSVLISVQNASVSRGGWVTVVAQPAGGQGRYQLTWTQIPVGCVMANYTSLDCTDEAPGTYPLRVTLLDSIGQEAEASAAFTVVASNPANVQSATILTEISLGVAALIIGLAAFIAGRRTARTRLNPEPIGRTGDTSYNPPENDKPEPPPEDGEGQLLEEFF